MHCASTKWPRKGVFVLQSYTQLVQKATPTHLGDAQPDVLVPLRVAEAEPELLGFVRVDCLLYTSPSPRDLSTSRMPSSA